MHRQAANACSQTVVTGYPMYFRAAYNPGIVSTVTLQAVSRVRLYSVLYDYVYLACGGAAARLLRPSLALYFADSDTCAVRSEMRSTPPGVCVGGARRSRRCWGAGKWGN